jgi:hypothetical protein
MHWAGLIQKWWVAGTVIACSTVSSDYSAGVAAVTACIMQAAMLTPFICTGLCAYRNAGAWSPPQLVAGLLAALLVVLILLATAAAAAADAASLACGMLLQLFPRFNTTQPAAAAAVLVCYYNLRLLLFCWSFFAGIVGRVPRARAVTACDAHDPTA